MKWLEIVAARAGVLTAVGSVALLVPVASADGGYFPTAWGWIVLPLAWVGCLALLLLPRTAFGRLDLVTIAALLFFVAWVAASIAWSSDRSQSILEVERDLAYVVALVIGVFLVRRRTVPQLLGGLLASTAAIAGWALFTRLFPEPSASLDPIVVNQLSGPIGYPNGLGIFCVMGAVLALGFAVREGRVLPRMAGGALLPLLLTTLYFSFSRGAWIAFFASLVALVVFDPRRLRLLTVALVLAPWSALAVWLSSRQDALTSLSDTYDAIQDEGRRVAVLLCLLVLASAATTLVLSFREPRTVVSRRVRFAWATALALVVLAGLTTVVVHYGGPVDLTHRAYDSFKEPPPSSPVPESDLNVRLFKLSGTYRLEQWRAAWSDYEAHPWVGAGAGTFETYWLEHRTVRQKVRDAHSLYLEVLAELGWPGLILLALALGMPLVAALSARGSPLAPPAFAAYVAYLLHAGVDWDWELPAITLAALLCGVALLALARGEPETRPVEPGLRMRAGIGVALLAIAAFSVVGLLGNRALAAATSAVDTANFSVGERRARDATRWMPWSGKAWQELGNAQLGLGDRAAARSSLLRAVRKSPGDWSIWFDLGTASRGAARREAYDRAAALNPLDPNVRLLRAAGDR